MEQVTAFGTGDQDMRLLWECREKGLLADVTVTCLDDSTICHRDVVKNASPILRKKLRRSPHNLSLRITVDEAIYILKVIYCRTFTFPMRFMSRLVTLLNHYNIQHPPFFISESPISKDHCHFETPGIARIAEQIASHRAGEDKQKSCRDSVETIVEVVNNRPQSRHTFSQGVESSSKVESDESKSLTVPLDKVTLGVSRIGLSEDHLLSGVVKDKHPSEDNLFTGDDKIPPQSEDALLGSNQNDHNRSLPFNNVPDIMKVLRPQVKYNEPPLNLIYHQSELDNLSTEEYKKILEKNLKILPLGFSKNKNPTDKENITFSTLMVKLPKDISHLKVNPEVQPKCSFTSKSAPLSSSTFLVHPTSEKDCEFVPFIPSKMEESKEYQSYHKQVMDKSLQESKPNVKLLKDSEVHTVLSKYDSPDSTDLGLKVKCGITSQSSGSSNKNADIRKSPLEDPICYQNQNCHYKVDRDSSSKVDEGFQSHSSDSDKGADSDHGDEDILDLEVQAILDNVYKWRASAPAFRSPTLYGKKELQKFASDWFTNTKLELERSLGRVDCKKAKENPTFQQHTKEKSEPKQPMICLAKRLPSTMDKKSGLKPLSDRHRTISGMESASGVLVKKDGYGQDLGRCLNKMGLERPLGWEEDEKVLQSSSECYMEKFALEHTLPYPKSNKRERTFRWSAEEPPFSSTKKEGLGRTSEWPANEQMKQDFTFSRENHKKSELKYCPGWFTERGLEHPSGFSALKKTEVEHSAGYDVGCKGLECKSNKVLIHTDDLLTHYRNMAILNRLSTKGERHHLRSKIDMDMK